MKKEENKKHDDENIDVREYPNSGPLGEDPIMRDFRRKSFKSIVLWLLLCNFAGGSLIYNKLKSMDAKLDRIASYVSQAEHNSRTAMRYSEDLYYRD